MGLQLSVEVERTLPVAVIRPRGVLDAYNAPDLRSALLECVAEQPTGVVVDAGALTLGDDVALTVLATVAKEATEWSGTRVLLAGASDEVAAACARLGIDRYVDLSADRDAAVALLEAAPPVPLLRERIEPDRNAPGVARFAVADFCQRLGIRQHDAAQLVASELVTNAVVHAGTAIDLTLRFVEPVLHIAVRDRAGGVPRMRGIVDESSESGRGLLLVDALAERWGSFVPHSGKIVWARVRLQPGRSNGIRRPSPG
jgi:anti-anti-sigma factor